MYLNTLNTTNFYSVSAEMARQTSEVCAAT